MENFFYKIFSNKEAQKNGFSLTELVIVIAVLSILAAVAIPAFTGFILRARQAAAATFVDAVLKSATILDHCSYQ